MTAPRGTARPDRSRWAVLALAFTVVGGTLLLLWGADWLTRRGVESVVGRAVEERSGLLERPAVRVHGTLVLPQALRGRYDRVQVEVGDLRSGPVRLDDVSAELTGVHLSFPDLLHGNTDRVHVTRSVEQAFLTYDGLNRYLRFSGRTLHTEPTGDGRMRVTGAVEVFGRTVPVTTVAQLAAEGDAVVLRPTELEAGEPLDGVGRLLVVQRFTVRVPLDPLPFGQRVTDVRLEPGGVAIRATGRAVVTGP